MKSEIKKWSQDLLPTLNNKNVFITGANSGIGFEAAKVLASRGANVLIGCRNEEKAVKAITELRKLGAGTMDYVLIDLSRLESVREAAEEIKKKYDHIDININNAGIMQTPQIKTEDGFDLQFATNHLGHFLLNALLFDRIEKVQGRIAVVCSLVHKFGEINFENLTLENEYSPMKAYAQSKLANLMYALELDRKLKESNSGVTCVACHPGYSDTSLQSTGPTGLFKQVYKLSNKIFAQDANSGATPTLLAAAGVEAIPGGYYGPRGMGETRGAVGNAQIAPHAQDLGKARKLWEVSEDLVGHKWNI